MLPCLPFLFHSQAYMFYTFVTLAWGGRAGIGEGLRTLACEGADCLGSAILVGIPSAHCCLADCRVPVHVCLSHPPARSCGGVILCLDSGVGGFPFHVTVRCVHLDHAKRACGPQRRSTFFVHFIMLSSVLSRLSSPATYETERLTHWHGWNLYALIHTSQVPRVQDGRMRRGVRLVHAVPSSLPSGEAAGDSH